ncbi:unnamed protein product [Zymoseptoria tritici ST99CH_3D7]|uniref:Galactosyl transferase GMA12/MNN10 family protein n=1 Tax=Zymoseptoria tritici (strain ST99CH_3D7) TaxID=1276538 RepID=A0A1X7RVN3_ZYMT9|nr:unnamed protein product [Zymoseptoria tritici ST99CH_3D7]
MNMCRIYKAVVIFIVVITIFVLAEEITRLRPHTEHAALKLGSKAASIRQGIVSIHNSGWRTLITLGSSAPAIGKITVAHGKQNKGYQQALSTHLAHAEVHQYPMFLLNHKLIDGLWNKEAALLDVVLDQLTRSKSERLEWLMWVDADTVIMNKQIPLEVFLPPLSFHKEVNLLYTKDWNGLNNGVFFLRVSPWAMEFLSSILAYRTFRPDEELDFTEQSAMARVLELDQYGHHAVECPPQWFNAYPNDGGDPIVHYDHLPGQLLVHFAGIGDKTEAIGEWVGKLEANRSHWEMLVGSTNYEQQIMEFWDGLDEEHAIQQRLKEEKERKEKEREKEQNMKTNATTAKEGVGQAVEPHAQKAADRSNDPMRQLWD